MSLPLDHAGLMDRVYRHQRHIYDATRKHYLIGRDPMLAGLDIPPGGTALEIGCGTGRNLVEAARRYPGAELFGIDISRAMLESAGTAVMKAGINARTRLALADAAAFDPARVFGRRSFDRIFISYALSMIPAWGLVMENAAARLSAGGELHMVDFGDCTGLPGLARPVLERWLAWHHVTPRASLFRLAEQVAARHGAAAEAQRLHRGFTWLSVIRKR